MSSSATTASVLHAGTDSETSETTQQVTLLVRPLKVVALICGLATLVLMVICLAASSWLDSDGFQQGLWYYCVQSHHEGPLPPGIPETIGCFTSPWRVYFLATGALCAATFVLDLVATTLLVIALCTRKIGRKIRLYKSSKTFFLLAVLSCIAGLVLFAVKFSLEYREWGRRSFEFGWAFGMGWGAVVFLIGALLLLCCDRETDTIYYAEKTIDDGP